MHRLRLAVSLAALLLALPLAAQDVTTLDGESAIRFMAGHAHLTNYCEGQLWITPTRLRFDSSLGSEHSFDLKRAEVKDFHAASAFGVPYMKTRGKRLDGSERTYRIGLYPNIAGEFGDRFRLAERAWRDFPAAAAEVTRVAAQRVPTADSVRIIMQNGAPVLEFDVFLGPQFLWFRGPHGVTIWAKADADGDAYGRIMGTNAAGKLRITAERVSFMAIDAAANTKLGFEAPRDEVRMYSGAGGYPRVVVSVRHAGRVSIVVGEPAGAGIRLHDVTPLLRALGPEFSQMAAELLARKK